MLKICHCIDINLTILEMKESLSLASIQTQVKHYYHIYDS